MSKYMNNRTSPLNLMVLLGALMFSLSTLPGLEEEEVVHSSDLSSQIRTCDLDAQIREDGTAECNARAAGGNKVEGSVVVTKVTAEEGTEARYTISGEFSIQCKACEDGVRSTPLEVTVDSLRAAREYMQDQADILTEETTLAEAIALCKKDEAGEALESADQLQCHINKMAELDEEQAKRYYNKHLKTLLHTMAQSDNRDDVEAAIVAVNSMHESMGLNCSGMQPKMTSPLQPAFDIMNPVIPSTTPTQYISESTCDLRALAGYNYQMQGLAAGLRSQNPMIQAQSLQGIQNLQKDAGWYFDYRGLTLNNQTVQGISQYSAALMADTNSFQKQLDANFAAIQERHKDMLNPNGTTPGTDANVVQNPGGRMGRDGNYVPSVMYDGQGAPQAWPQVPQMPTANPNGPAIMAPALGSGS